MDDLQQDVLTTASRHSGVELTAEEVIEQLTYVKLGKAPPHAALEAALALRDDITPRLLDEICLAPIDVKARYLAAPPDHAYFLHTCSFLLLGYFGEPRAYPLILDYFASDSDLAAELSGETLSGLLPSLLVRCYDGSGVGHLRLMVETPQFEPLFRFDCLQAWHGLVLTGRAARDDLIAFTRRLLARATEQPDGRWHGWLALGAAQLGEPSLRPDVEMLVDRFTTHVDGSAVVDREDVESTFTARRGTIEEIVLRARFYETFAANVCRDFAFLGEPEWPADAGELREHRPYVRTEPKIGRNDLCPCGSGKKYKRCCLH